MEQRTTSADTIRQYSDDEHTSSPLRPIRNSSCLEKPCFEKPCLRFERYRMPAAGVMYLRLADRLGTWMRRLTKPRRNAYSTCTWLQTQTEASAASSQDCSSTALNWPPSARQIGRRQGMAGFEADDSNQRRMANKRSRVEGTAVSPRGSYELPHPPATLRGMRSLRHAQGTRPSSRCVCDLVRPCLPLSSGPRAS
jgi:hypothetical protein